MKTLVVYGSQFGNTEAIANTIAEAIGANAEVTRASAVSPASLTAFNCLIVGSPTQGGRPTAEIKHFLEGIPAGGLNGIAVAAFDTRIGAAESGWFGRLALRIFGYAAPRIEKLLLAKGGRVAAPAEGFIVRGKEGPLRAGEAERAVQWARTIEAPVRTT